MEKKIIITIERQYGSGGEKIGELLAQRLGIAFFDKEILAVASKESNIEEEVCKSFDEAFVDTGIYSLIYSMLSDARTTKATEYRQSPAEQVYLAEFNAIRKLAKEQAGVFIGRCSDYILQEYKNAVHFFVHAPIDVRVERVCQYDNLNRSDAETIIRKKDREREKYYNYYTNQKWGDVCNYHLSIDTGSIELNDAAMLLEQYVKNISKIY